MLYSIFGFVAVADVFVSVAVVANAAALATAAAAIATAAAVGVSFVPMLPPLMSRMLLLMKADCSIKVKTRKRTSITSTRLPPDQFQKILLARIRNPFTRPLSLMIYVTANALDVAAS